MGPAPKAAEPGTNQRKPFGANNVPARRRAVAAVIANDGRYPDGSAVETRYVLTREQQDGDRSAWSWVPGTIIGQCSPDQWDVMVEVRELATLDDGSPTPPGTHRGEVC